MRLCFILLSGIILAILVAFEPFVANILSRQLGISIFDKNVIKLFKYELVVVFLLTSIILPILIVKALGYLKDYTHEIIIILFISGMHFEGLTKTLKIDISEITLFITVLWLVFNSILNGRKITITFLDLLNLLFVAAALLSFMNNDYLKFVFYTPTMIKFILILFVFANLLTDRRSLLLCLKTIVIMTCVSALIALFQEFMFVMFRIPIIGVIDSSIVKFLLEWTSYGPMLRVPAFFITYKPFTFYLNISILILFNYYIYNKEYLGVKGKTIIAFLCLLMLSALILTFSKDGVLSLLLGIFISLIIKRPSFIFHTILCSYALVLLLIYAGIYDDIWNTFSADLRYGEIRIRIELAREGIEGLWHRHPFIGIGIGDAHKYTAHIYRWSAHNAFIEAGDSVGIIGFIFYVALFLYAYFILIKTLIKTRYRHNKIITVGLLSGLTAYCFTIQFHPFFYEKFTWFYISIINAWYCYLKPRTSTA